MLLYLRKIKIPVNGFGAPFIENPSFHYLTHLLLYMKYFGQLRLTDCFPLEGAFSYLRQFFVATTNSTVTSFKKEMENRNRLRHMSKVLVNHIRERQSLK